MIYKVSGDILLTNAQAIAHGVAPNDHFNQGLALSLRERYPSMAKDFRHYCHLQNPKAGEVWFWGGADGIIINLMTQEAAPDDNAHPGKATTKYVGHALKALRTMIEDENITSIALPKLATGVGGLDWDEVLPLIEQHLGDLDIPVVIYESYVKGQKANEKIAKAA